MTNGDCVDLVECIARFRAVCRAAERASTGDWGPVLAGVAQSAGAIRASARDFTQAGGVSDEPA